MRAQRPHHLSMPSILLHRFFWNEQKAKCTHSLIQYIHREKFGTTYTHLMLRCTVPMKKTGVRKQTLGGGNSELGLQCAFRAIGHREDNGNLRLSSIFCGLFFLFFEILNPHSHFLISEKSRHKQQSRDMSEVGRINEGTSANAKKYDRCVNKRIINAVISAYTARCTIKNLCTMYYHNLLLVKNWVIKFLLFFIMQKALITV